MNPLKNISATDRKAHTKRRLANEIDDDEELKQIYERISGKPHPLDYTNFFSKLFFCYIDQYIYLSKKMIPTQECHHKLPINQEIKYNRKRIGEGMYGADDDDSTSRLPTDVDDLDFKMKSRTKLSLFKAFINVAKVEFSICLVLFLILAGIEFVKVLVLNDTLDFIVEDIAKYGKIHNKMDIFKEFFIYWFMTIMIPILDNAAMMQLNLCTMRLEGGIHGILYEKYMRIGIINPHEHDEGSIINYIQNDVNSFNRMLFVLKYFLVNTVSLVACISVGLYFFGFYFLIMVFGSVTCYVVNWPLVAKNILYYMKSKSNTDQRIGLMKDILKNLQFVKVCALENFVQIKLSDIREIEIRNMMISGIYSSVVEGSSKFCTSMVIIIFFFFYILGDNEISVSTVTTILLVSNMYIENLTGTVSGLTGVLNSMVHFDRLDLFLNSDEMIDYYKSRRTDPESQFAVEVKNGDFFWNKKVSKEEAEERRQAASINNSSTQGTQGKSQQDSDGGRNSGGSELGYKLLEPLEDVDTGFNLKNINFRAEKGKLTVIIGKIGSGKSSLIHAILGEVGIKDTEQTSIVVNGMIGFCSQKPWMINGTIKDNILLDKEYDQIKFGWALKYSALEHDIKIWDDKEMHIVGERGAALSGGQKARIALARCLYQR